MVMHGYRLNEGMQVMIVQGMYEEKGVSTTSSEQWFGVG